MFNFFCYFILFIRENKQLQTNIRTMESKVAVIPQRHHLRHWFYVLKYNGRSYADTRFLHTYKCIRTQDRRVNQALKRELRKGYTVCYFRYNVPNSINILNRVKEVMKERGIYYRASYNTVHTNSLYFVAIVRQVLEDGAINE